MLETGTRAVHFDQILIINVVNIRKIFNTFTKVALTSKNGGKIRKKFLHYEEKALSSRLFLHYEEKSEYYTI